MVVSYLHALQAAFPELSSGIVARMHIPYVVIATQDMPLGGSHATAGCVVDLEENWKTEINEASPKLQAALS